jgi:hypothetical protein
MAKDRLFLLKPDFMDQGEGPFFCPYCTCIEGMLVLYPQLRQVLEIHHLDFPRPRPALIAELGEENQAMPVLIVERDPSGDLAPFGVREAKGKRFLDEPEGIENYLAATYGVGRPH